MQIRSVVSAFALTLMMSACGAKPEAVAVAAAANDAAASLTDTQAYRVISVNSGLALDVYGVSKAGGAIIQQWPYWGSPNQVWNFVAVGDGSYQIISVNSGLCLDVYGISKDPGAKLQQWNCWNSPNQHWMLIPVDGGAYELQSVNSGLALDVYGISKDGGATLQQWPYWGGANQKWLVQPVDAQGNPMGGAAPNSSPSGAPQSTGRLGFGADPGITYYQGKYYLVQGDWQQHLTVLRSSNLATLMTSEAFTFTDTESGFHTEAPDIAVVTDPRDGQQKLAIYITKALPYPGTIKVLLTSDPAGGFEDMGYLANVNGYDAHYMTHPNGKKYLFFSNFASVEIIEMSTPWTTTGNPVAVSTASLPWETVQGALNEAPATVISGNTLNLVYSANTYNDPAYVCGLVTIPTSADPMVASNWTKHTQGPIFSSANGHYGPGSGVFFNDGAATWWGYGSFADPSNANREIRAQTVTFDANGVVQLGTPQ